MSIKYFRIPDSLMDDCIFYDARLEHQVIFIRLIKLAVFKPCEHNINGNLIQLEPGQLCYSIRKLAELCGKHFTRDFIVGAIKYFERVNFLRQEVRHGKSIITITHSECYELIKKYDPTDAPTKLRQGSDKGPTQKHTNHKKQISNINYQSIEGVSPENSISPIIYDQLQSAQTPSALRSDIFFNFSSGKFENISSEDLSRWKVAYPGANVDNCLAKMTEWCLSNLQKAKSKKLWRKFITNWLSKNSEENINRQAYSQNKPSYVVEKESNREMVMKNFKHYGVYNGATCYIDTDAVAFERGMTHRPLKFSEKGFKDQFNNILRKFGITVPE